jgi:hypothetical protein
MTTTGVDHTVTAEMDATMLSEKYRDACVAVFEAQEAWSAAHERHEARRKANIGSDCDRLRTKETGFCPCPTCNAEHDERMVWYRKELDARDAAREARKALGR